MEFTVGNVLEGTVKTITKFGAFIQLPEKRVGMVHISEISYTYVNDIREALTEGQNVKVKVMSIDEAGKISLSIKRAMEKPRMAPRPAAASSNSFVKAAPQTFEEKLKQFMNDSDSKISGCRQYEHRTRSRKR